MGQIAWRQSAACAACILGLCLTGAWAAAELAFEVVPPEKVAFNYPTPPREGQADFFTIAEDGKACCAIVLPERPGAQEKRAAATLDAYLDLATGADIPQMTEGRRVPEGMGVIHVGNTSVGLKTDLGIPDVRYGDVTLPNVNGYLVKTLDPKTLVIRGRTARATVLGVVGFLRRYVGVRRYWPGNPGGIGDVVPKHPTLRVPEVEWRDWPYFISHNMSGLTRHSPRTDRKYRGVVGFSDFCRTNFTIPAHHSYYKLLPPKKYGETHPEYYPLIASKRRVPKIPTSGPRKGRVPHGWQPCVSNSEVVKIMADALIAAFRKDPDCFALALGVNDGLGDCHCEKCRAMDAPGADIMNRIGLSDRYIKFNNQVCDIVQREFPDKIMGFIAYGSVREPPTTVEMHPMLMPAMCMGSNANSFEVWDKWLKVGTRHMGVYYYHDDMWFFIPKMDVHQSAKRIRYIVGSGRARHLYQECYGTWPLSGMVFHVENELLWDPRLDEDAILDEYYTKFYGPAAAPMKRLYDALESGYERWLEEEGIPHPFGKDIGSLRGDRGPDQFKVLNVREADAARAAIDQAVTAAKGDPVVSQRVDVVERLFGFAEIGARQYWAARRLQDVAVASEADAEKTLADARRVVALSRALAEYKRDVMEKPPANLYAGHERDTFYASIQVGDVRPEVLLAITKGFTAASDYLRAELGPERAGDWWHSRRQAEKEPLLHGAMATAEAKARGIRLANMVKDASFEARGPGQAPKTDVPLPIDHEMRQGLNTWHRPSTQMKCSLTTGQAHTGKYSVAFWGTQVAGICERVAVKQDARLHLSVWVRHNGKKARYLVTAYPRSAKKALAQTKIPIPWKPGEWQQIETDFTAPADTVNLSLYVFVYNQEPGAKVWVDDFFIGRYPE